MKMIYFQASSLAVSGLALLAISALPGVAAPNLDQGLALYLPLTSDLKDHSPARHPIEVVGHVRIESDGAYFGGRADWLEAPHIAINERPFAIALWIKDITEERTVGLLEQFDLNRPRRHFHLMLRGNRQPYFGIYDRNLISPLGVPRDQEWMHLVFQYTGSELEIWINGRLIAAQSSPPYEGETGVTAIGKLPRWNDVPGRDFVGYMRDVRIYQRALNAAEIGALAGLEETNGLNLNVTKEALPDLNRMTVASRATMTRMLSADTALPFLQISGRQITINGRAGQVYELQSSSDLSQWTFLSRLTNQTGRVTYDSQGEQPVQFFRVRVQGFEQ